MGYFSIYRFLCLFSTLGGNGGKQAYTAQPSPLLSRHNFVRQLRLLAVSSM